MSISVNAQRRRLLGSTTALAGIGLLELGLGSAARRLAAAPKISVPTITMEGDANGAPHPKPAAYAGMFTGKYQHRDIGGGIGHNLPQEAPRAFADAVLQVVQL